MQQDIQRSILNVSSSPIKLGVNSARSSAWANRDYATLHHLRIQAINSAILLKSDLQLKPFLVQTEALLGRLKLQATGQD